MADRRVLVLQARPEDAAADEEFASILSRGGLAAGEVRRVRLERDPLPEIGEAPAVILGGGPGCVSDTAARKTPEEARIEAAVMALLPGICERDLPFLGCCYGIGALGQHLGGRVGQGRWSEPVGLADCALTDAGRADPVLAGLPGRFGAFVAHKEAVETLPPGCVTLVASESCPVQMMRHGRNVYATQFHPEADGESFALRIRVYRDKGYFAAGEADRLTGYARSLDAPHAGRILANFVALYRSRSR